MNYYMETMKRWVWFRNYVQTIYMTIWKPEQHYLLNKFKRSVLPKKVLAIMDLAFWFWVLILLLAAFYFIRTGLVYQNFFYFN